MTEKTEKRVGKIVYVAPEKCYTKVNIEETPHGYRLYRQGDTRHFTVIPHGAVRQVEYYEKRKGE